MAYFSQKKSVEVHPQEKEVVIKLEITLNVNMTTGQVTVGAVPVSPTESIEQPTKNEMKVPEFMIPKFDTTTEIIEGFGEDN